MFNELVVRDRYSAKMLVQAGSRHSVLKHEVVQKTLLQRKDQNERRERLKGEGREMHERCTRDASLWKTSK